MWPKTLMWSGELQWLAEAVTVSETATSLQANGTQFGALPVPYRLDYELATHDLWITKRLSVSAQGDGWRRSLDLRHNGIGIWTQTTDHAGIVDLPEPGGDMTVLSDALDCDLGRCPLTNTMPVRRHDLHRAPGGHDFVMAWVSVPDLRVQPARQRYEHIRRTDEGAVVRYVGEHRGFVGELQVDAQAFIVRYPTLARRVTMADGLPG